MLLLIPLVVIVSVVYKTIRLEDLSKVPMAALVLSIQIVVFMIVAAILIWGITTLV